MTWEIWITGRIITNGKYSTAILKWWDKGSSNKTQSISQKLASVIHAIDDPKKCKNFFNEHLIELFFTIFYWIFLLKVINIFIYYEW